MSVLEVLYSSVVLSAACPLLCLDIPSSAAQKMNLGTCPDSQFLSSFTAWQTQHIGERSSTGHFFCLVGSRLSADTDTTLQPDMR
ncbi:hypothetical protein SCLCIDRAFT_1221814 [Scleroderma citrinum Foug A]|uniref:Secreted protein n=1 Tax=Scleroderma citrinum Foug A TaxID=1036808 RepID=A0A0C2YYE4_9AGAM|nr:hypothetical protein SCLCIDRAFT_1221814 [Scleroderma citrinum Foug A]